MARAKSLPNDEVQTIADLALAAWETQVDAAFTDTLGGRWRLFAERSGTSCLCLLRETGDEPDARVHKAMVSAAEFAAHEHIRLKLASMVLAMASPP